MGYPCRTLLGSSKTMLSTVSEFVVLKSGWDEDVEIYKVVLDKSSVHAMYWDHMSKRVRLFVSTGTP